MVLLTRLVLFLALAVCLVAPPQPVLAKPDSQYDQVYSYITKLKGASTAKRLTPLILKSSRRHGLSPMLVTDIMRVESYFNIQEVSTAGALGLMQVMPVHFKNRGIPRSKWFDPATNIDLGCRIYAYYKKEMKLRYPSLNANALRHRTLVAYNMGPKAVTSRGITRSRYSRVIMDYYRRH
ncbi:Membrane-bound lytic murein transglycosylase C precursor [compost metagenome]